MRILKALKKTIRNNFLNPVLVRGKPKIFCIGRNKTGTTSLKRAFKDLGYVVGDQRTAERLIREYKKGNFEPIIKYCRTAQVFQDIPFSYKDTFIHLDKAYPGSKFILTLRDSPDQWYNSVTKFHAKLFGKGKIPTAGQLKNAEYVWKGWMWESNRINHATPEEDPYQKEGLIKNYIQHNESVMSYFKNREEDLLVINLAETDGYQKFIDFLGIDSPFKDFPWENKTETHKIRP